MFAKVLLLALAACVNCQYISRYNTGFYGAGLGVSGIPVYRSSALHGGLYSANGWGYGANLGRVAGLGALRTSGAIIGGGALGYGTGALLGAPAFSTYGVAAPAISTYGVAAPAVSTYGVAAPAVSTVGVTPALGVSSGLAGLGLNIARGVSVHQAGPVTAAVQTVSRTVDYTPVPYSGEPAAVQDIDVPPQESPLRINFQSKSSPLAVTQQHIPAEPGQVQVTQSEDEPQTAIHNVVRPVVQRVNEIIQPYRSLTQTVEPVIEQTHTNIHQGEGVRLTGLTSGVVGGTGVLAASGVGVAAPAVSTVGVAAPALTTAAISRPVGLGLATSYGLGGLKTLGHGNLYSSGLYGTGLVGTGLYGSRVGYYGTGLGGVYGTGLYGARTIGYGLGNGLALNGLSGLSTYGTTAKIARI